MEIYKDFFDLIFDETIRWVYKNHDIYRQIALEIDRKLKDKLSKYFSFNLLNGIKIYYSKTLPKFDYLNKYGFTEFTNNALNLSYTKGIIFIDTLVISSDEKGQLSIVFYLLVHATLYKIYGTEFYIKEYVKQSLICINFRCNSRYFNSFFYLDIHRKKDIKA